MDNSSSNENEVFISKFNPDYYGFFGLTRFTDTKIGFSLKKTLAGREDEGVTLLSIYVPNKIFEQADILNKPLSINLTYGKEAEGGGVIIRDHHKFSDPIDLRSVNEYYYNISTGKFFKKDKEITADQILKEIYELHIRSTKLVRGLRIRIKLGFFRMLSKGITNLYKFISNIFSFILKMVSGITYKYDIEKFQPFKTPSPEKLEPPNGVKVNFLGYNASPQCIMFYATFHFIIFVILYFKQYIPDLLVAVFKNTFLILIYVMMSLIFVDKMLPHTLKKFIDFFGKKHFDSLFNPLFNRVEI